MKRFLVSYRIGNGPWRKVGEFVARSMAGAIAQAAPTLSDIDGGPCGDALLIEALLIEALLIE